MKGNIEFFDTETVDNKTVLICNSETYLWESTGLSMEECLNFMEKNSKKYNYFFRIDYDVNMILKELNKNKIIRLYKENEIKVKNFTIKYFKDKIFQINKKKFYDISNFFNTSLLNTIEILQIDFEKEEKEFIEFMKKSRSEFKLSDKEKIIKYSLLENKIGIKIVNKIYELLPEELKSYSLYGSSFLADKFLSKKGVTSSFLFNSDIFEKSYFGGRMEVFKIGTFKNVYKYDINSAYPSIIKDLRYPLFYSIKIYNNEKIIDKNIYEVEFNHKKINEIGSLPVRLKNGYLVFPKEGKGYYYGVELKEAIKRGIDVKIDKYIDIVLGDKIFNGEIEKYYNLRKQLKKEGNLKHLIYKILLNSIYGKFAQRVGNARFQNLYLAGFITASVRAKLLEATFGLDDNIIFFATDGILTKKPLNVKVSHDLGDFEKINIKKAEVLLSGIYRLIDYEGAEYRGERGFRLNFDQVIKDIKEKGIAEIEMDFFVGNLYAYKNYKEYGNDRCKFIKLKKVIDVKQQHKRVFNNFDVNKENNSLLLSNNYLKQIEKLPEMKLDEIITIRKNNQLEFDF